MHENSDNDERGTSHVNSDPATVLTAETTVELRQREKAAASSNGRLMNNSSNSMDTSATINPRAFSGGNGHASGSVGTAGMLGSAGHGLVQNCKGSVAVAQEENKQVAPAAATIIDVAVRSNSRSFLAVLQGDTNLPPQASSGTINNSVVKVNPNILNKRLDIYKFSVIGSVILAKGDEPWNLFELKDKLSSIWAILSAWRLISLGKGYYHILLSSAEERDRIWSRCPINLKPGVMRLQR